MKIVICPDKFKGSLTSSEFCEIVSTHIISQFPDAEVISIPMADGGEGTTEILTENRGIYKTVLTTDALMRPLMAQYGILRPLQNCELLRCLRDSSSVTYKHTLLSLSLSTPCISSIYQRPLGDIESIEFCNGLILDDGKVVIDLSSASGLTKIDENERNPELTSTFGFGLMIKDAIESGAKEIIVGIGGSATNDCGIGMLSALGVEFYDINNNNIVEPIGRNLINIENFILTDKFRLLIDGIEFTTACDVTNLLYGENGATYIYAPQKGADSQMCKRLDDGVRHFSKIVQKVVGVDISKIVGGGAAGGVGAILSAILNSRMVSGATFIAKELGLFEHIKSADYVITGEGKIDKQTLNNKLVTMVSKSCKEHKTAMIIICGVIKDNISSEDFGAISLFELKSSSMSINESINRSKESLNKIMQDVIDKMHNLKKTVSF